MMSTFIAKLTRKKHMEEDHMVTNLKRCLSTLDITLLGIGHMMGSGIYVLTPSVARQTAGPAIIISYLIAGVASLLAALAYAEFGVKFPRAGSAYSYSYFSVGEFWAFFVGWNVLLENVIGISAVARACSDYIDNLCGGVIRQWLIENIGKMGGYLLSEHPDFLAFVVIVLYVVFMSIGVQATSWLNNILCIINIAVLLVIICVGGYFADINNWTNPTTRGFMPFKMSGVLSASATCFFAYVGFDAIAAAGEEARNPQRSLPVATFCSMGLVTVLYIAVSATLTLMVNYTEISSRSGLPAALAAKGVVWAEILVTIGALAGMSTVLIGTLYALTRIAYAMADDGLIHGIFGKVAAKSQIPLISMYVFSLLAAILAVILDIDTLVEMMSIGTLSAYLIVSGGVIIFRYRPNQITKVAHELKPIGNDNGILAPIRLNNGVRADAYDPTGQQLKPWAERFRPYFPSNCQQQMLVSSCVFVIAASAFAVGFFTRYREANLAEWHSIVFMVVLISLGVIAFFVIVAHEQCEEPQKYKMPWVPFLPVSSIVINATLMTTLQPLTWGRLAIWLAIGLTGYFGYGLRHSKLN
ncbi:cationic amino acid transporter 4-like isoform X1 [Varroa destructor]|uniref:Cationic amino acid transporter C-terminal domain-containing protein n=2 Tax=Varroa destructor TaxID=109461 RepID=A0A7M7MID9_VARDE|nr:cationic amino acid transporter 4-like isoform X1 [Varroa destructor]XP_022666621.1 cationic amino acid transporter 4-like isoform X1 [Varroa destructor]XP_022666622.1 cationic amino acid transporter 4-like isoform X1 [Varroa destructor]XP_022666623.1 cationic amino acid transporter 4-like isoform X1 [Varroa destructor]